MISYRSDLKQKARALRQGATVPERLLWSRVRRKALGTRMLRQRPVGAVIVDFFAPDVGLVIEIDGRSHDTTADADRARQTFLESRGLTVLRFTNDEVLHDLSGVVERIAAWLGDRPATVSSGQRVEGTDESE